MNKVPLTIEMLKYQFDLNGEIEFQYQNKKYYIFFSTKILVGEQYNANDEHSYDDLNALLNDYKIDGIAFINILPETDLIWMS